MSNHSPKVRARLADSNLVTCASNLCHTTLCKLVGIIFYSCCCRDVGTASSWSLSRLDALADEVKTCFWAQHTANSVSLNAPDHRADFTSEDTALLDRHASVHSINSISEIAALLDRQASDRNAGSSTGSPQEPPTMQFWQTCIAWAVGRVTGVKHRTPHLKQQPREDKSPTLDSVAIAMQQYPMQTVAAINTVLYDQQGYKRMHLYGNPR